MFPPKNKLLGLAGAVACGLLAIVGHSQADVTTFVTTNLSSFNVGTLSGQNAQLLNATNAVNFTQMTSGALQVGGQYSVTPGGNDNVAIISNATLTTSGNYSIVGGFSATNNSLTLLSNTLWTAGSGIIVGYSAGAANGWSSNNALIVNSGRINVTGAELDIGWGSLSSGNGVIVTNGGRLNTLSLFLSAGSGANNNYLTVTGAGSLLTNSGIFYMAGASAGGTSNSVTIAGGGKMYNGNIFYLGYTGGGSHFITVTDTGSVLRINTNLIISPGAPGTPTVGNRVTVANGGMLINNIATVGESSTSRSNAVLVTGAGSVWSNLSALTVGYIAGADFNSVTVSNGGRLITTTTTTIGQGGNNNRVTVTDGAVWNAGGATITVGGVDALSAVGRTNSLIIGPGGIITNVNGLYVGTISGAHNNSLIASNGGGYFMNAGGLLQVGASAPGGFAGGNNNVVILSNSVLSTGGNYSTIGGQSSGNAVTLLAGTVWTDTYGLNLGRQTGASSNTLTVNGALVNFGAGFDFDIGWGNGANGNGLIVTNGGRVTTPSTFGFYIGAPTSGGGQADNNYAIVTGAGSVLTNLGTLYLAGATFGGSNNMITVADGGRFINVGVLYDGYTGSGYELVTVTGTGSLLQANSTFVLGNAGTGANRLIVTNAGLVTVASGLLVGNASVGKNSVLISAGGVLEANTMTIGSASGNTISNRNGTYQFTGATALTSVTPGDIALTDGTISFRATSTADVNSSLGSGALNKIRFAGANTFMLNAASNTTSSQNYTFQSVAGSPSNFVNLVLINGQTAFRGGNLGIGATGSLLVTNTTAAISGGVFSNGGSILLANGATLNSAADWISTGSITNFGGTIGGGGMLTNSGLIIGSGTLSSGVINRGTILANSSSALTLGGFVFNQASGVITANNSIITLTGTFTNQGTIVLINSLGTFPGLRNSSVLNLTASSISSGNTIFTNTSTGLINLDNGQIVDKDLVNQGKITSTGGLISNALINTAGAFIDIVSGVTTATPDLVNFGTITNSATFQIGSTGSGTVTNSGVLYLNGGTMLSGQITNTGLIAGNGSINGPLLNNGGLVEATNDTLLLTGRASGSGAYRAVVGSSAATLTFSGGGSISSLFNTGATVRVQSLLTNAAPSFVNVGTLAVVGSTYVNSGIMNNLSSGIVTANNGGLIISGILTNSGTITLHNNSTARFNSSVRNNGLLDLQDSAVTVSGLFSNSSGGTVSFLTSIGTFNSAVVNNGAWITDPSTVIFQSTYTLDSSGSISMASGDIFVFTNNASTVSHFINKSIQSNTTSMVNGRFVFDATLNLTQKFATAGDNIGNLSTAHDFSEALAPTLDTFFLPQFKDNFALGTLQISGNSTTMVFDAFVEGGRSHNTAEAALFLSTLNLGSDVKLIISNNVQVYFINSNGFSQAQVVLLGNSGLHQLVTTLGVVPEPSVLVMWFCGAFTLWAARRRKQRLEIQ